MISVPSRPVSPGLAFAVAMAGIGLFSVMDAFMKSLVLAMGVYNALIWRTGLSIVFGAGLWIASGARRPSARAMRLHLARGAVTAVMATLFFWGLARVPMAQAITLTYVSPILALLLAAAVLHERVGRHVAIASAAAFAGVLVVLAGHARMAAGPAVSTGAAAVLVSAALYAVNLVIARVQAQAAGPGEIAFVQSIVITGVLAIGAPWLLTVPDSGQWPKIVVAALLGTGSLALLGWAYAHGETGYLATTEYTSFLWAAALGWAVFGERVSPFTLAGAAIIVSACLYAVRRQAVAGGGAEGAA
ncbi:S-adenosylmethionine uptake transporter [Sphingomonas gellani]|uniref:S-adenosylmethionine uptake transporter n=1 Tax=Sphingomonas gellani TaxID=1166340 RepID=A0A1H8IT55_9SPHN|nr:DMT family transporter [Sphingomonas gellani]SEN71724.1 S-adenosylmethionine uptake transporter [Sphingomonas gellani]